MSHMVIYRGNDGKPGYHQTDDIHDAVGFVEQMRNEEGVEHARIFRLEEVVFEYKPYYRVELTDSSGAPIIGGSNGAAEVGAGEANGKNGNAGSSAGDDAEPSTDGAEDVKVNADSSVEPPKGNGESPNGEGESSDGEGEDGDVKTVAGAKKGLFGR